MRTRLVAIRAAAVIAVVVAVLAIPALAHAVPLSSLPSPVVASLPATDPAATHEYTVDLRQGSVLSLGFRATAGAGHIAVLDPGGMQIAFCQDTQFQTGMTLGVTVGTTGTYKVVVRADSWSPSDAGVEFTGCTYEIAHMVVHPQLPLATVRTPVAPVHAHRNRAFTVYGFLQPKHVSGTYAITLYCYRYQSGRYVLRKTVRVRVAYYSSYSRYAGAVSLPYTGRWAIRAYHADSGHRASWSGYDYLRVY